VRSCKTLTPTHDPAPACITCLYVLLRKLYYYPPGTLARPWALNEHPVSPAACKCRSPSARPIVDARSVLRHAWMLELMNICEELKQLHTDSITPLTLQCVPALMCTFTRRLARSSMGHLSSTVSGSLGQLCMPRIRRACVTHHHDVCLVRAVLLCSCRCRRAAGQGCRLCREVLPGTKACPAGHSSTLRPASPATLHGLSPEDCVLECEMLATCTCVCPVTACCSLPSEHFGTKLPRNVHCK